MMLDTEMQAHPDLDYLIAEIPLDQQRELRGKIGRLLRAERKRQNKGQEEAARAIGMSRPHLSNVEMGRSRSGWDGILRMVAYYGVGLEEMLVEARAKLASEAGKTRNQLPAWLTPSPTIAGAIVQYSGDNLDDYEKWVMREFHVLDAKDRFELIEQIRLAIQRRLQARKEP